MKIYTKTGDQGQTSLFGGDRIFKDNIRVDAYGTVDELNSFLGHLSDIIPDKSISVKLKAIQNILFNIGSILATVDNNYKTKLPQIQDDVIEFLEHQIDAMDRVLPQMTQFILPSGHPVVSFCHMVRTVCRRAERNIVSISQIEKDAQIEKSIIYLNRLSDYLFVLSRFLTQYFKAEEVTWKKDINFINLK
jgi:cob(I)alamin adenosyltransferase